MKKLFLFASFLQATAILFGQYPVISGVNIRIEFDQRIRPWDGFGFNYVETAQTTDYDSLPQEYGGFSLLDEKEKSEIIDMVFGEDGLKVGLVKMFCDPFHQTAPGGSFDDTTTTANMREFVRRGLATTRKRGADLDIITTLYGPPAYMTLQKVLRGRDLDPEHKDDLAAYMVEWVEFLREKEKFPVNYISLHNEGEDWSRWPLDGSGPNTGTGHDYNLWYRPALVAEMIKLTRKKLDGAGLTEVGVTPGETSNWYRFSYWGYSDAISRDEEAVMDLALITSHGFYSGTYGRWFGDHNCLGTEMIREKKPGLHAWVTSTSWGKMDSRFIMEMHDNIYSAGVNAIIPWAGIQRPVQWIGGDPNPGSAFTVSEDGSYRVRRGYYFYKQVTRAGQPGTWACRTISDDSEVPVIAFGRGRTETGNAFVVTNINTNYGKTLIITVSGSRAKRYSAFRTTEDRKDLYSAIGTFDTEDGSFTYDAPAGSVTTFFAEPDTASNASRSRREIQWVNPGVSEMPGLSHHILDSRAMGHEVGYVVWTPKGYSEKSRKKYPVIYFLHGAGGNESADAAGFSGWVSRAIEGGSLPPVICVFPNGGMSGYRGDVEKMIIEELIPVIDKDYHTIADAGSRALAGFSMGGSGSVYLAIMHPELFCAAGSMGGGIRGGDENTEKAMEGALPAWKKKDFGFFLANGDKDRPEAFRDFAWMLDRNGIDHKVMILPDTEHNLGLYYERSVGEMISFLGKHFK